MIDNLELHHLRTLNALYASQNLSLASEKLHISQQAISAKLKKMRVLLGDRLFVAEGHGVVPTPYAKHIQPYIESVLSNLNAIPVASQIDHRDLPRAVVVSATDYAQQVLVKELAIRLKLYSPNTKMLIMNVEFNSLNKKMSQGEIDLVFTTSAYVPEGLNLERLLTEKYCCVAAKPLESERGHLSLKELVEHEFVVTNPASSSLLGSADAWFQQQGLQRKVAVSAPSFYLAKQLIKSSDLVGFIPSRLLPEDGLYAIPLVKYPPGYELVAAFHPSVANDPLIQWLIEQVKLIAKELASA
ncbi:transcriptional regulator [Agarivorans sp. Toyoura001]|uniref:LysR family transcriptional regulator n=1 Tax=Agarivorans sp. Toyoura001 TaxID=2283141 RepID=UPI0010EAF371|nr:LysR family transcriptional regulator [Agarivorans sp. Toyoura001]GDY28228.1 transcriptional regulator [Agarivorans sp. Toyoura001]